MDVGLVAEESVGAHIELAATTYPGEAPADEQHFRWKHLSNPFGPSVAITLAGADPGRLRGRVLIQRRDWVMASGDLVPGGLITDLVIAPESRSAASFVALMAAARTTGQPDVVMHTANETSEVLYRRLLRYPVAFDMTAHGAPTGFLRIGRGVGARRRLISQGASIAGGVAGLLSRIVAPVLRRAAGMRVTHRQPDTAVVASTLLAFRVAAGPHFMRNPAFLGWRFGGPAGLADLLWIRLSDGLIGYAALADARVGDVRACAIQDVVIARPPRRMEGAALRATLMAVAARSGAHVVLGLWNPKAPLSRWMIGLPFSQIPDRLLPHGTPIFVAGTPGREDAVHDASRAFVTLGDLDYF